MKKITVASLLFILTFVGAAQACMHFDKNYQKKIIEGTKQILLYHDGQNAHLVLKTDLSAEPGQQLPAEISWVLPLPALPVSYEESEVDFFDSLYKAVYGIKRSEAIVLGSTRGPVEKSVSALKVHPTQIVGNYTIQPIEIVDTKVGKELNTWLETNNYNPMPQDLQKPYLKKSAVFLAIRMKTPGESIKMKPLHVVYPAKELSYPIRFTHPDRVFNAEIYLWSPAEVSKTFWKEFDLTEDKSVHWDPKDNKQPAVIRDLIRQPGILTVFKGYAINKDKKLAKLKNDPSIRL